VLPFNLKVDEMEHESSSEGSSEGSGFVKRARKKSLNRAVGGASNMWGKAVEEGAKVKQSKEYQKIVGSNGKRKMAGTGKVKPKRNQTESVHN
jgi:hypothetical protein